MLNFYLSLLVRSADRNRAFSKILPSHSPLLNSMFIVDTVQIAGVYSQLCSRRRSTRLHFLATRLLQELSKISVTNCRHSPGNIQTKGRPQQTVAEAYKPPAKRNERCAGGQAQPSGTDTHTAVCTNLAGIHNDQGNI
jgi:hypothetical protein